MKTVRIKLVETNTPPEKRSKQVSKAEYTGHMLWEPSVGRSFAVIQDDDKGLMTSVVEEITPRADGWVIKTMNSIYDIEVLSDPDAVIQ